MFETTGSVTKILVDDVFGSADAAFGFFFFLAGLSGPVLFVATMVDQGTLIGMREIGKSRQEKFIHTRQCVSEFSRVVVVGRFRIRQTQPNL